jgi:hypothetical protein
MRHEFLNGASDDDDAVVKAFAHANRESALKTKPKVCHRVIPVSCFSDSFFQQWGISMNMLGATTSVFIRIGFQ